MPAYKSWFGASGEASKGLLKQVIRMEPWLIDSMRNSRFDACNEVAYTARPPEHTVVSSILAADWKLAQQKKPNPIERYHFTEFQWRKLFMLHPPPVVHCMKASPGQQGHPLRAVPR